MFRQNCRVKKVGRVPILGEGEHLMVHSFIVLSMLSSHPFGSGTSCELSVWVPNGEDRAYGFKYAHVKLFAGLTAGDGVVAGYLYRGTVPLSSILP